MALPATLVWEIRPTNGTTDAGGGFDPSVASPGTDFSQQNAVQQAYTDIAIDAVTNTDITSAAFPFGATAVGNNIAITGGVGFTTGVYNIRSVTGVIARLDRSPGAVAITGGIGNMGGARKGFAGGTNTLQAAVVAGNTIYVKNEAWNEAVSVTLAATATLPVTVIGYNTARNDNPTGSNRPTNDRNSAGTPINGNSSATNWTWKNIVARRSLTVGWNNVTTNILINCKSDTNGTSGFNSVGTNMFINCESNNNTTAGFVGTGGAYLNGCYSHDNTTQGIAVNVALRTWYSIFEANSSHGIGDTGGFAVTIINCTVNGNTGASTDGLNNTTASGMMVFNTIFSNNGRYGMNFTTSSANVMANYNNFFGNATAARNGISAGANDQALDPQFTDAANANFTIGPNLAALGWPGMIDSALSISYLDIGAVQRQQIATSATFSG